MLATSAVEHCMLSMECRLPLLLCLFRSIAPARILPKNHKSEQHYWACMASTHSCMYRRAFAGTRQVAHAGVLCRMPARHTQ